MSERQPQIPQFKTPGSFRVMLGIFGVVFGGAGLCFLGAIWSSESDFVPTFAKLFISLVACAFVAFGGFMVFNAITSGKLSAPTIAMSGFDDPRSPLSPVASATNYVCPNCGAALGEKVDVSPMGDVKCAHCGRWFNVHKQA